MNKLPEDEYNKALENVLSYVPRNTRWLMRKGLAGDPRKRFKNVNNIQWVLKIVNNDTANMIKRIFNIN